MIKRPTFKEQSIALLKRNILLKKRNWTHFLFQTVVPILLVVWLLFQLRKYFEVTILPEIPEPIGPGTNWKTFDTPSLWVFVPQNDFTVKVGQQISQTLKLIRNSDHMTSKIIFLTTDQLLEYYKNSSFKDLEDYSTSFSFAAIFDNQNETEVSYTLRMIAFNSGLFKKDQTIGQISNCRTTPFHSSSQTDPLTGSHNCPEMLYYTKGFTYIQTVIDSAIIRVLSNNSGAVVPNAELFIYPKPSIKTSIASPVTAICVAISFVFSQYFPFLTSQLVTEKEKRIKEAMFMMGLRPSVYWFVWFSTEAIIITILSMVISVTIYLINVIKDSNIVLTFLLVSLFGFTLIELSAFFSIFFDKEMTATQISRLLFLIPVISMAIFLVDLPLILRYILSLFSPIAFGHGIRSIFIITVENESTLSLYNIFFGSDFPIGIALILLFLEFIVYGFIIIYLDKVMPGKYGTKQSLFFCFNKNYWFPQKTHQMRESKNTEIIADIEEVSTELKQKGVISIENISKKFKESFAVNNLSMTIYESQITALLGHNGAGKTTLINMLLGAIPPTSGTAYIYGKDVTNPSEMSELRPMFGVCLQENILFDELDSEEHLLFFGEMKAMNGQSLRKEVNRLLIDIDLYQNRYTFAKDLSGGQKRKLCLAIALIAGPKVVILDEPTSGVDIAIRRQIWTIIGSYKSDKTIIMTTHFMEEADVMSDRKAIISKGKLRCMGSSLFLKQRFGVGYHLIIELNSELINGTQIKDLTAIVINEIPNSKFDRFIGSEVFYILPQNQSQKFPKLFKKLEDRIATKKDIKTYGISMTTLEEVFLKLEDEEELLENNHNNIKTKELSEDIDLNSISIASKPNISQTFWAYFYVKLILIVRNPWNLVSQQFVIVSIIIVLILFKTIVPVIPDDRPLLFTPDIYEKSQSVLRYQNKGTDNLENFSKIVNQFGVKTEPINDLNLKSLNSTYMSVSISEFKNETIDWKWYFNETHIYSLQILQNLMANTYLRHINGSVTQQIKTSIRTFEDSLKSEFSSLIIYVMLGFYLWMWNLVFGIALALEPIDDRETKVIETIRISGMGFSCYWTVNLLIHSIILVFETLLFVAVVPLFVGINILNSWQTVLIFSFHIILSITSMMLFLYAFGQLFDKKTSAQTGFVPITFISLLLGFPLLFVMNWNFIIISIIVILLVTIWPLFGFVYGTILLCLISMDEFNRIEFKLIILSINMGMFFSIMFYFFVLKIIDKLKSGENFLKVLGLKTTEQNYTLLGSPLEDDDVLRERSEVKSIIQNKQNLPILLVHELRKVFSKKRFFGLIGKSNEMEVAVNNLSFMVRKNNIFGLLGPNGAGKTTTMKIIIKQERPTHGLVMINGKIMDSSYLHKQIGYCPQHDSLFKDLTLKEHLRLFAAIRGVKNSDIDRMCNKYMTLLRIKEHENKKVEHLSGGTKRKLCYILSLFGPSNLVLLDEPSTGMDPYSKRFLWNTIQNTFSINSSKSAVLTTHSMEEANALCTRIAIMTKGIMRCIGSVQHLKNKYGAGYTLDIKWKTSLTSFNTIKEMISKIFKEWKIREQLEDRLTADIPQYSVESLSMIFLSLENMKSNPSNGIQEYSFSQTTLEQVFIYFAKEKEIIKV